MIAAIEIGDNLMAVICALGMLAFIAFQERKP